MVQGTHIVSPSALVSLAHPLFSSPAGKHVRPAIFARRQLSQLSSFPYLGPTPTPPAGFILKAPMCRDSAVVGGCGLCCYIVCVAVVTLTDSSVKENHFSLEVLDVGFQSAYQSGGSECDTISLQRL